MLMLLVWSLLYACMKMLQDVIDHVCNHHVGHREHHVWQVPHVGLPLLLHKEHHVRQVPHVGLQLLLHREHHMLQVLHVGLCLILSREHHVRLVSHVVRVVCT